jgi:tRNA(Ile)-lysidine synthase
MGSSRKRARGDAGDDLTARVGAVLDRRCLPGAAVCLGYSGGIDSTVLLHLLAACRAGRSLALSAIHVHHGLRPSADDWADHCERQARALGVPLDIVRVSVDPRDSRGVEAAARAARYAALAASPADHVALAHHRDDQAETVLLQLLRGAGVKGCAAMAEAAALVPEAGAERRAPRTLRPLLGATRADIERYALDHGVAWVEDDSNRDVRYARNHLRCAVIPALTGYFPRAAGTLARAAAQFAEAADLLEDLARIDAGGAIPHPLPIALLRPLSDARRRNLLRAFVATGGGPPPGKDRLGELLRQALDAAPDARVGVRLGDRIVRRYRDALWLCRDLGEGAPIARDWHGEAQVDLGPSGGRLFMRASTGAGLARAPLEAGVVTVRTRTGGERLRTGPGGHGRSLKNLFQERAIPPWLRDRLPVIWCGAEPVWVAGVGAARGCAARDGEPSVLPVWEPPAGLYAAAGFAVY